MKICTNLTHHEMNTWFEQIFASFPCASIREGPHDYHLFPLVEVSVHTVFQTMWMLSFSHVPMPIDSLGK